MQATTPQARRARLAKAMWREVSNYALRPARPLTAEEWEPTWNHTLGPAERDVWRRAADAALAAQEAERARAQARHHDDCSTCALDEQRVRDLEAALAGKEVEIATLASQACVEPLDGGGDQPYCGAVRNLQNENHRLLVQHQADAQRMRELEGVGIILARWLVWVKNGRSVIAHSADGDEPTLDEWNQIGAALRTLQQLNLTPPPVEEGSR